MSIEVTCFRCGRHFSVPLTFAGQSFRCSSCGTNVKVDAFEEPAYEEQEPASDSPYFPPMGGEGVSNRTTETRVQNQGVGWLLFSAQGRIPRSTWWASYFAFNIPFNLLTGIVVGIVTFMFLRGPDFTDSEAILTIVLTALPFTIFGVIINLNLIVKRLHDRDHSGWFYLIALIPMVGGIWLLVELGFLPGTEGPNRFGEDPLVGS